MIGTVDKGVAHPNREKVLDLIGDDETVIFWDGTGFDDAILGIGYRFNDGPVVVYESTKLLKALMDDGMSRQEATEYFAFNIIGGWLGEKTPIVMVPFKE